MYMFQKYAPNQVNNMHSNVSPVIRAAAQQIDSCQFSGADQETSIFSGDTGTPFEKMDLKSKIICF